MKIENNRSRNIGLGFEDTVWVLRNIKHDLSNNFIKSKMGIENPSFALKCLVNSLFVAHKTSLESEENVQIWLTCRFGDSAYSEVQQKVGLSSLKMRQARDVLSNGGWISLLKGDNFYAKKATRLTWTDKLVQVFIEHHIEIEKEMDLKPLPVGSPVVSRKKVFAKKKVKTIHPETGEVRWKRVLLEDRTEVLRINSSLTSLSASVVINHNACVSSSLIHLVPSLLNTTGATPASPITSKVNQETYTGQGNEGCLPPANLSLEERTLAGFKRNVIQLMMIDGQLPSGMFQVVRQFSFGRSDKREETKVVDGGRLKCSAHGMLSSDDRKKLVINGQRTVELDIATCQPRILFAMVGIDLGERDIYSEMDDNRERAKSVVMYLTGVSHELTLRGFNQTEDVLNGKQQPVDAATWDRVKTVLHPVWHLLGGDGAWRFTQRKESDWLIRLMELYYAEHQEHPILSWHDSVVVVEEHAELVEKMMIQAWQEIITGTPLIKSTTPSRTPSDAPRTANNLDPHLPPSPELQTPCNASYGVSEVDSTPSAKPEVDSTPSAKPEVDSTPSAKPEAMSQRTKELVAGVEGMLELERVRQEEARKKKEELNKEFEGIDFPW
jgi:hypothetical protein